MIRLLILVVLLAGCSEEGSKQFRGESWNAAQEIVIINSCPYSEEFVNGVIALAEHRGVLIYREYHTDAKYQALALPELPDEQFSVANTVYFNPNLYFMHINADLSTAEEAELHEECHISRNELGFGMTHEGWL